MKTKIKLGILYFLLVLLIPVAISTDDTIGYELVEDGGEEYLHVWNQGDIEPNYYYENECLSQVSNHLGEQWETVTKYLGTYINGQWYEYEWGTEDPCARIDLTDNETYVNNSATTYLHLGAVKVDLTMLSHLKTEDDYLTQRYSFYTSKASQEDVWFLMDNHYIQVGGDEENDYLKLYPLDGSNMVLVNLSSVAEDLYFNSSEYDSIYFLSDIVSSENILNYWGDNDYEWYIKVDSDSVGLYVNLGEFDKKETKYFEKQWVDDALCTCFKKDPKDTIQFNANINLTDGNETYVGEDLGMACKFTQSSMGGGYCSGCDGDWKHNQYGSGELIPTSANATDILECQETGECTEKDISYGTWYNKTITCNTNGTVGVFCEHEDAGDDNYPSGARYIVCNNVLNESQARLAIEEGINLVLNEDIFTDKWVYLRYSNNNQDYSQFDKFVTKDNQSWAFNYLSSGDTSSGMSSFDNWIYVWENTSLSYNQIVNQVSNLISENVI